MSKIAKTTFRLLDILVILVMTFGQPMSAFAAVWTDQQDYSPGSVVTINGDNSDGAGYLPQETVHVDVAGPNGYVSSCEGSADDNGAWSCQVTLWPGLEAVGSYTYTATGLSSGVTETGRFTDAAGSYSIKWYAADPAVNRAPYLPTYTKVKPNQMACPTPSGGTGRAADPMPNAVGYGPTFISSDLDAVTSLAPKDLALGQIVPFELEITVSGSTAPENGVISVTPYWLTKVTNGADFGFDPSYGVYCAFVDTADPGTVDPGGNAKVNSWTSGTVNPGTSNEQIQGTLQISGLNDGDNVIVEIWVVLKSSIAQGIGGNVQTGLADARTASGTKINIGNQTVPLLQVGSFFTATADLSVTKSDSPDPVVQGQTLTYSLVVTNNSTDTVANGIVVTDTLDPNVSFVSGSWSGGTCTASAGVVTCNVGSLSPLGSTTITIVTTVSATAPVNNTTGSDPVGGTCTVGSGFDLCNTVSLTAITSDPTTANNSDSEPTNVLSSFVPAPALSLLKQISTSASGPWSSSITVAGGSSVYYQFTITNTGNVALDPISVSDPTLSGEENCVWTPAAPLAPAGSSSCVIGPFTAATLAGTYPNTATASGGYGGSTYNSGPSSAEYVVSAAPSLSLVKSATPATYSTVGDVISYSYLVTNNGNVKLAGPVTVDDDKASDEACPDVATVGNLDGFLDPGESITCTASYTITQTDLDNGSVTNVASASAGGTTSPTDTETVTADQTPNLTVTKEATETTYSAVGDVIHYSILVTNDGNVTLHNVTVSDPNADNLTCTPGNPVTDLAPGDTINCTAEHTIVQADLDAGHFGNAACVDDGEGGAAEACDTVDTPGTQNPAIRLTKSATLQLGQNGTLEAGDTVLYGFVIQNIGNVTLTGVDLDDALLGYTDVVCGQTTLAPGASTNCTATYTLTQADIDAGSVTNLANACGTPPTGSDVCDVDSTSTPLAQYPAIQLTKSATLQLGQNGTLEAGDTVLYGFVIQNIGNVTLTGVDLDDSLLGYTDVTCGQTTLVPGASTNCTASYTLLQADIDAGSVTNLANACGTPPTGPDVCDTDSTSTPLAQNPAIQLTKSATLQLGQNGTLEAGDTVLYGFVITNIGNVTLTGVDLDDALLGYTDVVCGQTTLAPGASTNCTASYTLLQADIDAGSVTNFANACGTPPTGSDVCDVDVTTTPLPQRPSLSIVKDTLGSTGDWGDGVFVVFNENVSWRYIVTNTGNVTLTNVAVTDNKLASSAIDCGGGSNIIASLAPGASVTCTAGPVVNTVAIGTTYNNIGTASTTFGSTPVSATDPSSYTSRPFGLLMTNTELCSLPNDQFRLLFTPDQGKGYKLNATNPGQFYYNMFYVGAGNETVSLTLPYPWVTQGNVPIHIYADVAFTTNSGGQTCLTPSGLLPNPTQTYVTLQSYGQQAFGQTTTVQVNIPATGSPNGFLYINIHLDYGLKDTTYWTKGALNQAIQTIPSGVTYPTYPTINDLTPYTFLDGKGSTTTITSTNVFKKNPGIGGLVTYSGGGAVVNTSVEIKLGTKVMATVKTDADGWYMWSYKWTGKAVTFTVKLLNYYPAVATKSATLKANGFVQVNFEVP